jgi:hypothetical protein
MLAVEVAVVMAAAVALAEQVAEHQVADIVQVQEHLQIIQVQAAAEMDMLVVQPQLLQVVQMEL